MNNSNLGNAAFDRLVDEFLLDRWRFYPTEATFEGIHDFDCDLEHLDRASIEQYLQKEERLLSNLDDFKKSGALSDEKTLDLKILECNLKRDIVSEKLFNRNRRDPSLYIGHAIFGCMAMMLRDFAPREIRHKALISRLKQIPHLLQQGMDNMNDAASIPPVWVKIGVSSAQAAQKFFSGIILNESMRAGYLKHDMLAAATLASKAFKNYSGFLEGELLKKSKGDFAAGEEYFDFLLREFHLLPYNADRLEKMGLEFIESTLDEIKSLAAEISPHKDWTEVIESIKNETPSKENLLDHYRNEIAKSRDFIVEHDLVTIPDDESLKVIETPASHRNTYPYAAYLMAPPFEKNQEGIFWVTPVDESAEESRQREQLAGHSHAAISVRTLHEGYPGHHLQYCHANRVESKVRRIYGTSVFAEGWALYCEQMMNEQGYYDDKQTRLMQLKDQLWRACRIVIDVRLHTKRCTYEEAVDMLVRIARIERSNAESEVNRYTQSPTQPMSYLIGKLEIIRLLQDYRRKNPALELKKIHDTLLSYGTVPPALVRNSMLGTN